MSDLISRNKLKEDLIKFFPTDCLDGIESKTLFNQILHDIDNAPTVEERPIGEWEIVSTSEGTHFYGCSECHFAGDISDRFCRRCGAKMEK